MCIVRVAYVMNRAVRSHEPRVAMTVVGGVAPQRID
jgi:hypothetical protein